MAVYGKEGAIRVTTDSITHRCATTWYSGKSGVFPVNHVHGISEDASGNEWILTDNGLGLLSPEAEEPVSFLWKRQGRKKIRGFPFIPARNRERRSSSARITEEFGVTGNRTGSSGCFS